jgi:hypothetical protein
MTFTFARVGAATEKMRVEDVLRAGSPHLGTVSQQNDIATVLNMALEGNYGALKSYAERKQRGQSKRKIADALARR